MFEFLVSKATVDEADDLDNSPRVLMPDFIFEHILQHYGLKSTAEKKLFQFLSRFEEILVVGLFNHVLIYYIVHIFYLYFCSIHAHRNNQIKNHPRFNLFLQIIGMSQPCSCNQTLFGQCRCCKYPSGCMPIELLNTCIDALRVMNHSTSKRYEPVEMSWQQYLQESDWKGPAVKDKEKYATPFALSHAGMLCARGFFYRFGFTVT